jgi:hypothetical protein
MMLGSAIRYPARVWILKFRKSGSQKQVENWHTERYHKKKVWD